MFTIILYVFWYQAFEGLGKALRERAKSESWHLYLQGGGPPCKAGSRTIRWTGLCTPVFNCICIHMKLTYIRMKLFHMHTCACACIHDGLAYETYIHTYTHTCMHAYIHVAYMFTPFLIWLHTLTESIHHASRQTRSTQMRLGSHFRLKCIPSMMKDSSSYPPVP